MEDMAMRTYDFTPLWRSTIGFDHIFDLLNNNPARAQGEGDYPPYNIERSGEDAYRVSLALAGFSPEEISITAQQNLLTVTGEKVTPPFQRDYLHHGIAERPFELRVSLEDHVEVEAATFENGLLQIDLARRVPEAMKPRRIQIGNGQSPGKGTGKAKTVEHVRAA
jgi:molecular chaperone IbpA